jgi:amino acid adenylation domain-containing protein
MAERSQRVAGLPPEKLQRLIDRLRDRKLAPSGESIGRQVRGDGPLPLSFGQERLWFLDRLEPGSTAYNMPAAVELRGSLNVAALAAALHEVVRRHEPLRTRFEEQGGEPAQRILAAVAVDLPLIDLGSLPADIRQHQAEQLAEQHGHMPFDLRRGPLFATSLLRLGPREHRFLLVVHHIVADGWSMGVLVRELAALYEALAAGRPAPLPELPIQYADFALWQRQRPAAAQEEELAYWLERLGGEIPVLDLPTDRPRPAVQTYRGGRLVRTLEPELARDLRALCAREGATPFMALLAGFAIVLQRWSGQDDLLVGTPVAGRRHVETEGLIGIFLNTLVLRLDLSGEPSFRALLSRVREVTVGAFSHQDLPFEALLARLRPERDPSRTPLFQVLFNLLNYPRSELRVAGLTLELMAPPSMPSKFDLTIYVREEGAGLAGDLVYNADLFDSARVEELFEQWQALLSQAIERPEQRIADLSLVTPAARRLFPALDEELVPAQEEAVHERFVERARRQPGRLAAVDIFGSWTYGDLAVASRRVCDALRQAGIDRQQPVAIYAHRSAALLTALLGILRAGAAFLILDPAYPTARLLGRLSAVPPRGWIGLEAAGPLPEELVRFLADHPPALHLRLPGGPPSVHRGEEGGAASAVDPDGLAYFAFTSGSTGQPKAICGTHRPLSHFLSWHAGQFGLGPADRFSVLSGLSHDPLLRDLLAPLWVGASLHFPPSDLLGDGDSLARWLRESGITVAHLTPAVAQLLAGSARARERARVETLRYAFFGGDRVRGGDLRQLRQLAPWASCVSFYGATETPQAMGWREVDGQAEVAAGAAIPLGRGIPGVQLLVLDRRGDLAGIGELGAITIRSPYLASGYLDPALTAERFIPDPGAGFGGRLYCTGDLGRYLPDGEVAFAGRADRQVKVRGFRVEPAEVEAALAALPGVRDAAVLACEHGGESRLIAYVVPDGEERPEVVALRAGLRRELPAHAVPSDLVLLARLPLTPNGKVDTHALARLRSEREAGPAAPAGLQSALEREIAALWREVLGVERVGVEDNFFDLGGHSLLLARLHDRLQGLVRREFSLVELFSHPTVRAQAAHLSSRPASPGRPAATRIAAAGGLRATTARRVAVVGLACRFPGARDATEFWELLRGGVDAISSFSIEELESAGVDPAVARHPKYVPAAGVLDDEGLFDAAFFDYSPREAALLDPQHRLFLECAWQSLEDAGYDPERFAGGIGVFAGVSFSSYLLNNLLAHRALLEEVGGRQAMLGLNHDYLATRVSYKLNLRGPSVNVQSACSTALVAAHLACQALLAGECDLALAGAAAVKTPQRSGYLYQEGGIDSPSGRCRAFDARADGTVWGNGAGVVVLKRLEEALSDGDRIHAVILASAVNNDGSGKVGFTAPSVAGQAAVIAQAQELAGVAPETIGYVECHGSATALGDPIEVAALRQAFGETEKKGFCPIGSVKTNIGHLGAAAGAAGLIKTVLALAHREIPPSLHFVAPNPGLELAGSAFYVNRELAEWRANGGPRRAGVSSFGLGGTNAHMVLEEAPEPAPAAPSRPLHLLVLSARSEAAVQAATENLAGWMERHPEAPMADIAYTLQVGRRAFPFRRTLACADATDARRALAEPDLRRLRTAWCEAGQRPVAFLLPGLGDHYPGMARGLYDAEPLFRAELDRCAEQFSEHLGTDLRRALFADGSAASGQGGPDLRRMLGRGPEESTAARRLDRTLLAQPAVFSVGYALAQLWMSWGVRPEALLGYSLGEYLAACLAGVYPLADAVTLVAERARLIEALPCGSMLAVPLSEEEAHGHLDAGLSLAAVNGPHLSVVAGPQEEVAALAARLAAAGLLCREIPTTHAFHSPMMAPAASALAGLVRRLRPAPPRIPYISNVTGTWIRPEEVADPEYWARHLCGTVRFAEGLRALWAEPSRVLLEVGPGQGLSALALQQAGTGEAADRTVRSLPHRDERREDGSCLLDALGQLWLAGVEIDWAAFHAGKRRRLPLPTYPFERRRYWIEPAVGTAAVAAARPVERKIPDIADWFHIPSWKRLAPLPPVRQEPGGRWLVFLDECGVGMHLVRRLEATGCEAVVIGSGERFERLGERLFRMDPRSAADYRSLFAAIGEAPARIVHLWALMPAGGAAEPDLFDEAQALGFESLLVLGQVLGGGNPEGRLEICVAVNGLCAVERGDPLHPEKATLLGPAQVIPQEYPHLACRVIDLDLREGVADLAAELLEELAGSAAELVIARRGSHRWAPAFEAVRLEAGTELPARLRRGGTYLITGGLGRIGLVLAGFLARTVGAKLVLIGRSAPPERVERVSPLEPEGEAAHRIGDLQALEASGAEVLVLAADVTDEAQMRAAVGRARERFGRLDGAFHLAGIPGEGLIQLKSADMARSVLAPKAHGALVLATVLADQPPDFLTLFSSVAAVAPGIGQVDECAASAFLDAFAQLCQGRGPMAVAAIDWCEWEQGRTASLPDAGVGDELRQRRRAYALTVEEGMEVLCRVLASGLPQVIVATGDLQAARARRRSLPDLLDELARGRMRDSAAAHPRPSLASPYTAPRDEVEVRLAEIWQELLDLRQVGVHDDFFQLGGHSLLGLQLLARVRESFAADLTLPDLFAAPTVADLAAAIAERGSGGKRGLLTEIDRSAGSRARQALDNLDRFSDQEVDDLLLQMLPEEDGG